MLLKIFASRKNNHLPVSHNNIPPNLHPKRVPIEEKASILQIIHAGGLVERYYMAYPAVRIMEKHPNLMLTRPEIFRRPWDSVVRPEEILVPGQKYFMVPPRTVKKLRRRIRKPSISHSFVSKCSISDVSTDSVSEDKSLLSSKSFLVRKPEQRDRHVRFVGIDDNNENETVDRKKSLYGGRMMRPVRKRRVRFSENWQPSLLLSSMRGEHQENELR